VDWMTRLPWGPVLFSSVISVIACTAILGFGMAPKMLVPIAWGTAIAYSALDTWAQRRFPQR
jgi:hypothetical protein